MKSLGNILWFVFGGFFSGMAWILSGIIWCLTIIGIPIGKQCFKFASVSFFPFRKAIVSGGGAVSTLANMIWILFFGLPMAMGNAAVGLLWCITIVGIPFGKQFFKIAKLALTPFGSKVI